VFALQWKTELCVVNACSLELGILAMTRDAVLGLVTHWVRGCVAVDALPSNSPFAHLGAFVAFEAGLLLVATIELQPRVLGVLCSPRLQLQPVQRLPGLVTDIAVLIQLLSPEVVRIRVATPALR
jgi:hypothetical protein